MRRLAFTPVVLEGTFEEEPQGSGVEVVERATQTRRCFCRALLKYGVKDVKREPPPVGTFIEPAEYAAVQHGGWPHIICPECGRALLVSGVF